MATAVASIPRPLLSSLLCRSIVNFQASLHPFSRVISLDLTPTHVSLSLSDRSRLVAAPFGILARTSKPTADAKIINSALLQAEKLEEIDTLDIQGLVVNVRVGSDAEGEVEYVKELMGEGVLTDLKGVLFYGEGEVVRRVLERQKDFVRGFEILPPVEKRKRGRFVEGMELRDPLVVDGFKERARVSASEVLQVVLDEMRNTEG